MTWVRFDDGMPLHPKVLGLSDGAYRLWTNGLAFSNRAVTDGRIPAQIVPTLDHRRAWTRRQIETFARELVAVGLWRDCVDFYEIHAYAEYQEEALKTSVEARKFGARERKRRQRNREKQGKSEPGHGVTPRDMGRDRGVTCHAPVTRTSHPPVPSRPVPSMRASHATCVREPGDPGNPDGLRAALRRGYAERYLAEAKREPSQSRLSSPKWDQVCAELERRCPGDAPAAVAKRALDAFFACPAARRLTWPVGQLATGIDAYAVGEPAERDRPGSRAGRGMRPVSPDSEFSERGDDPADFDRVFGIEGAANG